MECPVSSLLTPLNALICPSGSHRRILDSRNCNFRTKSKIQKYFHWRIKVEAGLSFHQNHDLTFFLRFRSFDERANRVRCRSRCHKTCLCLTFEFWRKRRCSLPRLFRSLKLPLPLKRPVLKFSMN